MGSVLQKDLIPWARSIDALIVVYGWDFSTSPNLSIWHIDIKDSLPFASASCYHTFVRSCSLEAASRSSAVFKVCLKDQSILDWQEVHSGRPKLLIPTIPRSALKPLCCLFCSPLASGMLTGRFDLKALSGNDLRRSGYNSQFDEENIEVVRSQWCVPP